MLEIPYNADHTEVRERYKDQDDAMPCIICGRPVKVLAKKKQALVHMFWSTHIVTEDEAEAIIDKEGEGGDMYFYPIGHDCLRKHPEIQPYVTYM